MGLIYFIAVSKQFFFLFITENSFFFFGEGGGLFLLYKRFLFSKQNKFAELFNIKTYLISFCTSTKFYNYVQLSSPTQCSKLNEFLL